MCCKNHTKHHSLLLLISKWIHGSYIGLLHSFEVWTGQIFSGRFSDCDGLVGHYIEGRHCRAPRLLPAQCLGTGREGEGQAEAEVGPGQVPVFTGGVTVPVLPHQAAGAFPLQARFRVRGCWVGGQSEHARHVEIHLLMEEGKKQIEKRLMNITLMVMILQCLHIIYSAKYHLCISVLDLHQQIRFAQMSGNCRCYEHFIANMDEKSLKHLGKKGKLNSYNSLTTGQT